MMWSHTFFKTRFNQSYQYAGRQPAFVLRGPPGKPGSAGRDGRDGRDGSQGARGMYSMFQYLQKLRCYSMYIYV
jgi:hypothetical protein